MTVNEPVPDTFEDTPVKDRDPEWFKRAVFYEVLVRSFQDSDGDGIGDLKGLTAKLDYLQWLGVDCLWLPPFFKSPLRDGGYDVADYTAVLPDFGDLADFVEFVDAAHQRGMRVIIDFVMNHTEILAALRFWLDLGIDGFRLDAVPYLYAAEGTNCENLPASHAFLKRVRKEIDTQYPDTVLLAEANQWPEDVVD
uniref:alpha-amylase family glycosyl hydrolase n=1 Tax=Streptomyces sp. NRRL S-37 TaxID=1463903 RepID=UPI0004C96359